MVVKGKVGIACFTGGLLGLILALFTFQKGFVHRNELHQLEASVDQATRTLLDRSRERLHWFETLPSAQVTASERALLESASKVQSQIQSQTAPILTPEWHELHERINQVGARLTAMIYPTDRAKYREWEKLDHALSLQLDDYLSSLNRWNEAVENRPSWLKSWVAATPRHDPWLSLSAHFVKNEN